MTDASGGKFWSGFAAGALSSIASSAYSGGSSYAKSGAEIYNSGFNSIGDNLGDAGMVAFATVTGGVGAKLTGGNFWVGAVTGLTVGLLNHYAHQIQENKYAKGAKEYVATVVSEVSDNADEAEASGSIIINRLALKNEQIEAGFIDKIGGVKSFKGIYQNADDYNAVMKMSLGEIGNTTPGQDYYLRIKGALTALYKAASGVPLITKAFFWNASYPANGFNFNQVKQGVYVIDTVLGATTYFRYANPNKHWP